MNALHLERKDWIKRIQSCTQCIIGITFLIALVPILLTSLWFYVSGN